MNIKKKLIVILGPTASGKSQMALKLAKKFNGEIVSADSRTIYQGMDIGTAKPLQSQPRRQRVGAPTETSEKSTPTPKGQRNQNDISRLKNNKIQKPVIIQNIPHYLIDIIRPDQQFTVALFKRNAIKIIKDIHYRKKIPFLIGGTGLYISSIVDNLKIPRVKPNYKLRKKLTLESKEILYKKLLRLDPTATDFVDKDNPRRLIRAIEICQATRKSLKELRKKGKPLFDTLQIGIKMPNDLLRRAINKRIRKMFRNGLVNEVRQLYKKYGGQAPGLNSIGYKEIISYLKKEITLKQAQKLIEINTHHYAKRQITWFKRDKRIIWLTSTPKISLWKQAEKIITCFLKSSLLV